MTNPLHRYICEYPLYLHSFYPQLEVNLRDALPKLNTILLNYKFQIDGYTFETPADTHNRIPFKNAEEIEQTLRKDDFKEDMWIYEHITVDDFTYTAIFQQSQLNDPSRERWTLRINTEEIERIPNWEHFLQIIHAFFKVFSPPLFCFMSSLDEGINYPNLPINYFEPLPQIYFMNYYSFSYMDALGITLSRVRALNLFRLYELDSGVFFILNPYGLDHDYEEYLHQGMQMILGKS